MKNDGWITSINLRDEHKDAVRVVGMNVSAFCRDMVDIALATNIEKAKEVARIERELIKDKLNERYIKATMKRYIDKHGRDPANWPESKLKEIQTFTGKDSYLVALLIKNFEG